MQEQKSILNKNNLILSKINYRYVLNLNINNIINLDLLRLMKNSYYDFFQFHKNINERNNIGLHKILNDIFPIYIKSRNYQIHYVDYRIHYPNENYIYCLNNGVNYSLNLFIKFKIFIFNEVFIEEICLNNIPMLTNKSTFIINGIEKVIISRLIRAPGLYLFFNKKIKKKVIKIIPDRGSEIDFYINNDNLLILRSNGLEILLTDVLKTFGYSNFKIIDEFFNYEYIYFFEKSIKIKFIEKFFLNFSIPYDIKNSYNEIIVKKNDIINEKHIKKIKENSIEYIEIDKEYILNRFIGEDVIVNEKLIININEIIDTNLIDLIFLNNVKYIKIIYSTSKSHSSILFSLKYNKNNIFDSINTFNKFIIKLGYNIIDNKSFDFKENNYLYFFISKLCRKRINYKLKKYNNYNTDRLNLFDFIDIIKLLILFNEGYLNFDDMQNLENLIFHSYGEELNKIFYEGFIFIKKFINYKIFFFDKKNLNFKNIINLNSINLKIKQFFNVSKFSQFLDQLNSLSELSHKRKVSFLDIIGISKKHSGFNVRDLNTSHYSRLCPVETPEGINIGLISSLALFCKVDKYNYLTSPYYKVISRKYYKKIIYLNAISEKNKIISSISFYRNKKYIKEEELICRCNENLVRMNSSIVNYIDINSFQSLSASASLIPFIQHNDSNRALMASNMLRQSLPLIYPKRPLIGTGTECIIGLNSNMLLISKSNGSVRYVDNNLIIIKKLVNFFNNYYFDYDFYHLNYNYKLSNQNTNITQRPIVNINDKIHINQILVDGSCTDKGDLALGQNVLVSFMAWEGYNFEDSIIISERLLIDEKYTSLELYQFDVSVYKNEFGNEITTNNINTRSNLSNLDDNGIIKIGSIVNSSDILLGKITYISKNFNELSPEMKLINSVFNENKNNSFDSSYYLPDNFGTGTVNKINVYFSEDYEKNEYDEKIIYNQINSLIEKKKIYFKIFKKNIKSQLKKFLIYKKIFKKKNKILVNKDYIKKISFKKILRLKLCDKEHNKLFKNIVDRFLVFKYNYKVLISNIKSNKFTKILPVNVIKLLKFSIIKKKKLRVGDKMSGRHGNKGVISKILPVNEMPYMSDGRIIDVMLNPLGIPSRMNMGQLLEIHLGLASFFLGLKIKDLIYKKKILFLKKILLSLYDNNFINIDCKNFSKIEILNLSNEIKNGLYLGITSFCDFNEDKINFLLKLVFSDNFFNIEISDCFKKIYLYDGRTGKRFHNPVTTGIMYLLKLNHLVENKMHARSVGPYSLITQQPLKGKSNIGGQRLGEMEVWALKAHGASNTIQEMLTVKSDDIKGRREIYKNILNKNYKSPNINIPESFFVMKKTINALGMYIDFKN